MPPSHAHPVAVRPQPGAPSGGAPSGTEGAGAPLPSQASDQIMDAVRHLPPAVRATPEVSAASRNATLAGRISDGAGAFSTYSDARQLGVPLPPFESPPVPGSAR